MDDLVLLEDVSLKSIQDALQERYAQDKIYPRISDIYIAINPFKSISQRDFKTDSSHIWGAAKKAFDELRHKQQGILITGESGAGSASCGNPRRLRRCAEGLHQCGPAG